LTQILGQPCEFQVPAAQRRVMLCESAAIRSAARDRRAGALYRACARALCSVVCVASTCCACVWLGMARGMLGCSPGRHGRRGREQTCMLEGMRLRVRLFGRRGRRASVQRGTLPECLEQISVGDNLRVEAQIDRLRVPSALCRIAGEGLLPASVAEPNWGWGWGWGGWGWGWGGLLERKLYRVDPNCETWPNTLTENPY
jgi:hypothetical protein